MTYGFHIQDTNHLFIKLGETANKSALTAAKVGMFVDEIPIVKYVLAFVPGAGFQKAARIGRQIQEAFRERPSFRINRPWCFVDVSSISLCIALTLWFRLLAELDLRSSQWLRGISTTVMILITNER